MDRLIAAFPGLSALAPILTWFGDGVFWPVLGAVLLIPKRTRKIGMAVLFASLVEGISNEIVKDIICRPRPFALFNPDIAEKCVNGYYNTKGEWVDGWMPAEYVQQVKDNMAHFSADFINKWLTNYNFPYEIGYHYSHGYSFPSGHTASSFAAAMAIVFASKGKKQKTGGIFAVILAAIVGFTRVYLHVHYCTDVLAGVVFGTLYALAGFAIGTFLYNRYIPTLEEEIAALYKKFRNRNKDFSVTELEIDKSKTYQTFEGMGASAAWWSQAVGEWTNTDENGVLIKDRIIDLLYGKEKGIGLRTYRYNIGAGSRQSGRGYYSDEYRATYSFDKGEGQYDFTADEGAVYMMKKAAEAGTEEFILFVNSPVERLTANHKGHVDKSHTLRTNLPKENVDAFVRYTLDVAEHFIDEGIPVKYISPINEPVWVWNGGQEGCHYKPHYAGKVMRAFAIEMNKRDKLKDVKLSGMENGDVRWFNMSYTRNLMKYEEVRDRIDSVDVHSYFLNRIPPFFYFRTAYISRFGKWVQRKYPGLNIRMSEWCHMCGGKDVTMVSGLVTANTMYEDLAIMNASSWQHWLACSPYDYCDGIIYLDDEKQEFELTKRYFVTGNFTKYVPYGAKRIKIETENPDVKVIAFTKDDETEIVLINNGAKETKISFPGDFTVAVTDENSNLEEKTYAGGSEAVITPKSVNTIICRG